MKKLIYLLALMLMPMAASAKTYDLNKDVFKIRMGDATVSFVCFGTTAVITTTNRLANVAYPTIVTGDTWLCQESTLAQLRKKPR